MIPEYETYETKPFKNVAEYLRNLERKTGVKFFNPNQASAQKVNPNLLVMSSNYDNVLLFKRRHPDKD